MVKSLLGVVAVLLVLGSPCLAAESKAKAKTDAVAAKIEYDKLGKKDLEDVLKSLQKDVLDAEAKVQEAQNAFQRAQWAYTSASRDHKPEALLRMLESQVAIEKPDEHSRQVNRDFQAAQQAYLKLITPAKPKPQPVDAASAKPKRPIAAGPQLHFETVVLQYSGLATQIERAKVKGGWLVVAQGHFGMHPPGTSITFYPDPNHEWDGGSLK
jgi:hypothetical protein